MPDMINPQKGIDLMNNNSIINRILFAVTIFQHSPLTRRVFYNIIRREREGSNINNIWNTDWHIYKSSESFSHHQYHHSQQGAGMASSSSASTWISITLIHHHQ
jgi:hypothetical protein